MLTIPLKLSGLNIRSKLELCVEMNALYIHVGYGENAWITKPRTIRFPNKNGGKCLDHSFFFKYDQNCVLGDVSGQGKQC